MPSNGNALERKAPQFSSTFEVDPHVYKTLLESTNAIPWKLDWASQRFTYIGPQIEDVLGWPQDSWVTADDWMERIHPDEREEVSVECFTRILEGIDHEKDYRALRKDGRFVWIRDVVHVVRNEADEIESLIGFKFDITERKIIEQKHVLMQQRLERFSYEDGLTKVSNRRQFDIKLEKEWQRAITSQSPLSLILLDIDHFKEYNDRLGHIQGDHCLVSIASTLNEIASNACHFFARFGGEEFAILLPDTDGKAATAFAELCRAEIEKMNLPTGGGILNEFVTASFGVGTILPNDSFSCLSFCEIVDQQLYRAKNDGRNCIRSVDFRGPAHSAESVTS